jgi:16S rRNA (guanine527-N7)-methyltransferase
VSTAAPDDWEALRQWSAQVAGLRLDTGQLDGLRAYVEVLLFWNRKLALVSQAAPGDIIAKHVADSLFVAAQCGAAERVVDLGSGAGFPGLPIALARPRAAVCLIESRGKKASFLEEAARASGARNLTVCNARIEAVAVRPEHRGQYTVATARALTSAGEFLRLAEPFLTATGRALAMRSTAESRAGQPVPAAELRYVLPDGTPRRLLVFRHTT